MYTKLISYIGKVVLKRPVIVLTIIAVVSVALGFAARGLRLESSMVSLLPNEMRSVRDLRSFQEEFGSATFLTILIEHSNRGAAVRFMKDFADSIVEMDEVLYVDYERPHEYFKDRALLYIDVEDLDEMDGRILEYIEREKHGYSAVWGSMLDLTDEGDPLDFSDIIGKYKSEHGGERFVSGRYYENADGNMIAFLVRPRDDALDLKNNRRVLAEIESIERRLNPASYDKSLSIGYTGNYKISLDHHDYLTRELVKVSLIIFIALILLVVLYFRRISVLFLLSLPLGVSMVWTGGIVALTLGHINLITSFSGGALLGLGSDYAIYLLSRYWRERKGGASIHESYLRSFGKTGRATVGALITTVLVFLILFFSEFKAFYEFGFIGVVGIVSTYVLMMLMLPAMISLFEKWGLFAWEERLSGLRIKSGWASRFSPSMAGVLIVLVVIGATFWKFPSFLTIEYNLKDIERYDYRIASLELEKKADDIFRGTLRPAVIVADNRGEGREIVAELERRSQNRKGVIKRVLTLADFIPENQSEKWGRIRAISEHWKQISSKITREKFDDLFGRVDGVLGHVITQEGLPEEVTRLFVSPRDGSDNSLVYVFSDIDRSTTRNIGLFGSMVSDIPVSGGSNVSASGEWMITYDIMNIMNKEVPTTMVVTLMAMLIFLIVDLRRIGDSLILFSCLVVNMLLFCALMIITGTSVNILNVAMVPIIVGTGIDSLIHFYYRYREDGSPDIKSAWSEMFSPILIANLTTIVGFGGFVISGNAALRSIGMLAITGVVSTIVVSLFFFPVIIGRLSSLRFRGSGDIVEELAIPSSSLAGDPS